jgi:hypothetical protein
MEVTHLAGSSKLARESNDFYPTPPYATHALLEREIFQGSIWEPACGDGAISEILLDAGYSVKSTDLHDRGYGGYGFDFLKWTENADNIITNPPYKLAQEFVEHALICANDKVAMLLKLNFLEGQARNDFFKRTPLKTVYVFSKRLSFDKGNEKGKGNGVLAYAWFVWKNGYEGKPQIDWIL